MQLQLQRSQAQDGYTDALTVGPTPGVMDALELKIEAASVYAQFAVKVAGIGEQTFRDTEYLLLPGSRNVDNICGARFRNAQAGQPALVSATLKGPDVAQIGAVFGDFPLVGPPLFTTQQLQLGTAGPGISSATAFSGVPPSGYTGVLVYAAATANPVWLKILSRWFGPDGAQQYARNMPLYLPPNTQLYAVFGIAGQELDVGFQYGQIQDTPKIGVWPTNLAPGCYLPDGVNAVPGVFSNLLNWVPTPVLGAAPGNVTADLIVPYFGPVDVSNLNLSGGNTSLLQIFSIDHSGAVTQYHYFDVRPPGNTSSLSTIWIPPGRPQVLVENLAGPGPIQFDIALTGHYSGLTP